MANTVTDTNTHTDTLVGYTVSDLNLRINKINEGFKLADATIGRDLNRMLAKINDANTETNQQILEYHTGKDKPILIEMLQYYKHATNLN